MDDHFETTLVASNHRMMLSCQCYKHEGREQTGLKKSLPGSCTWLPSGPSSVEVGYLFQSVCETEAKKLRGVNPDLEVESSTRTGKIEGRDCRH